SAHDGNADTELRGALVVVIDQAFTITVEILEVDVAARIGEKRTTYGIGRVKLHRAHGLRALAPLDAEQPAIDAPQLQVQLAVAVVILDVRVVFLIEIGPKLGRHGNVPLAVGQEFAPRRL